MQISSDGGSSWQGVVSGGGWEPMLTPGRISGGAASSSGWVTTQPCRAWISIYTELRQLAAWNLSRLARGETLQATALVHEAWLRLAKKHRSEWEGRKMFFAAAAQAMRDILVEDARRKGAKEREGGRQRIDIQVANLSIQPPTETCSISIAL